VINRLEELYKERGRSFIDKLLGQNVIITEQVDASAFSVERRNDGLHFYKKESDRPIGEVDRTLVKFYEWPIRKIESLGQNIHAQMPEGWRFGMEYVAGDSPKMNLTHIQVRNRSGHVVRSMHEKSTLDGWAKTLRVMGPRILFEGVVDGEAKAKILDWLYDERPKTGFSAFLLETVTGKRQDSAKSVVIRFVGEDESHLAKVMDTVMEATPIGKKIDRNDTYNLTVLDFMNFMADRGISKWNPTGKTFDQRYLSYMCKAFNDFVDVGKAESYRNVDFGEPDFMRKPDFDVNVELVPDQQTKKTLENAQMRRLFKIIIAAMRKKKKKASGVMTKDLLVHFNAIVDQIKERVQPAIKESEDLPSFSQFRAMLDPEEEEEEDPDALPADHGWSLPEQDPDDALLAEPDFDDHTDTDEPVMPAVDDTAAVDVPGLLNVIDQAETEEKDVDAGLKSNARNVNVIVGRFQPLHNGHISMAEQLKKVNGLPCVFVVVHSGANKSGKSPFEEATIKATMEAVLSRTEDIVGYCVVNRGLMEDVTKALRPRFEPVLWGAGADRFNGYLKQAEYNAAAGNPLKLSDDFDIFKTERVTSGTSIRQMIDNDDFNAFKGLVPKEVAGMWTLFRRDIFNDKNK
jgi:cytidyltransferase-like protein